MSMIREKYEILMLDEGLCEVDPVILILLLIDKSENHFLLNEKERKMK